MQKKINSKAKGKRGELDFVRFVRSLNLPGISPARGQQYSGVGADDIVGMPGLHVEIKNSQTLRLYQYLGQAVKDCQCKRLHANTDPGIPIVFYKKNREKWVAILEAEEFLSVFYSKK